MRKVILDEEEMMVLAVLSEKTRTGTVDLLREALEEVKNDRDMTSIIMSLLDKLSKMSDADFEAIDLELYLVPMEDEDEY